MLFKAVKLCLVLRNFGEQNWSKHHVYSSVSRNPAPVLNYFRRCLVAGFCSDVSANLTSLLSVCSVLGLNCWLVQSE